MTERRLLLATFLGDDIREEGEGRRGRGGKGKEEIIRSSIVQLSYHIILCRSCFRTIIRGISYNLTDHRTDE